MRMNCKKHRHFRLGLQEPHIYGIVPKSTHFFHNFLQKTLVACLDRFKCVYDKGGPHPSTWQHCSHGNAVRRRYTPLAHRFEPGRLVFEPYPARSAPLTLFSSPALSPLSHGDGWRRRRRLQRVCRRWRRWSTGGRYMRELKP